MEKITAVVFSLLLAGSVPGHPSVKGTWNTVDDRSGKVLSEVRLYQQGSKLFGKIVALTEPNDAQGKPKVCTKCQGGDKDKPVVGFVIIKDLALDGDRYKGGTFMDPEDGKIYKAEIWPEDGALKVRGSIGLLERTQTWVRAQ